MPKTLVTFLLDRTGSMENVRDDTIGAFNSYLETLQDGDAEEVFFSLLTFDSVSVDKVHVNMAVKEVPPLDRDAFVPRAWTPLIDASVKTIRAVEKSVNGGDAKVVICILTDGDENASTEHNWTELNALIKEKTAAGWQFNFMGAGIDAYKQGQRMGISAGQTMSYNSADPLATKSAFRASASNTMSFARGLSTDTSYSVAQKQDAGDAFDPLGASPMAAPVMQKQTQQARTNPNAPSKTKIVDDITL